MNSRYLAPKPGETKLSALLYGKLAVSGLKCYEIEQRMNVSAMTLRKILQHPETASMDKIRQLARILNITKTEMCCAWTW